MVKIASDEIKKFIEHAKLKVEYAVEISKEECI
jgi:hypothetical protein